MTLRIDRIQSEFSWLIANLLVWLSVVFLYSQTIGLWHFLVATFGLSVAGVMPLTLTFLLVVTVFVCGRKYLARISWPWITVSAAFFIAGLLSTDPAFPAKRVHIPEYFALTLLVYWSCRPHMLSLHAIWGAVILSIGLGGIDEILQGAMATRTFGLRDIGTNALGALSAGLFIQSFSKGAGLQKFKNITHMYVAISLFGLVLLLLGANANKGAELPLWIFLPAFSVLPLSIIDRSAPDTRLLDALGALNAVALILLSGIDALDIDFR